MNEKGARGTGDIISGRSGVSIACVCSAWAEAEEEHDAGGVHSASNERWCGWIGEVKGEAAVSAKLLSALPMLLLAALRLRLLFTMLLPRADWGVRF